MGRTIKIESLIKIYKQFKREPNKTFIAKDFFNIGYNRNRIYLNTLIKLGLIKQVSAIYFPFGNRKTIKDIKGYRLI